ncbi:RING-H2 finger protein ATL2-like [Spinacia oleracea]|uniref:RING-type E3 ubiquitin transferase n=1 Tax=Spinacia oleracea TaxID=3562 RepID=A0A9R0JX95_SPIOL|nr:RING-H2 finger protein ATL2-like [Spinacia oleracea]
MDHVDKQRGSQDYVPHESKGYALSGRIMLSAIVILFAVVVIMVCLHVYARWYILRARRRQIRRARRRTHLVFYIEPDNPTENAPNRTRGLDAAVLKSLPTFTFGKAGAVDGGEGDEEVLECAVCLSEFEEKEKGRLLPKCNHSFHVECIDMWFHSHSTCPLCRSPVDAGDLPPLVEAPAGEGEVVIELGELTQSQPEEVSELSQDVRPSQGESAVAAGFTAPSLSSSLSFAGRRKGLDLAGVSIEVPKRSHSFCFPGSNSDESGSSRSPFKSPTSRMLSLKRILSRDKRSPLPSPSPSGGGPSSYELDIESGRVESSSQALT